MAKTPIDSDVVRSLAELLNETGLTEIEYDTGALRIRVARTATVQAPIHMHHAATPLMPAAPAVAPAAVVPEDLASHPGAVTSPMVGVGYLSPEPGAASFVKLGDTVSDGQTLLLIEAMKTFNPIRAPKAGKVAQILIKDGQPVEYGEPLMIIE
jgi:acetyl-CoA carboxylase biotin carboxyl carrier protein